MITNPLLRALSRALTLALFLIIVLPLLAAPGDLDPSWGEDGVVVMYAGMPVFVAHTADGKVVAGGLHIYDDGNELESNYTFGASRYHPDGQPDTSFGMNGNSIVYPFDGFNAYPTKGAMQSDGGIVMVAIMEEGEFNPNVSYLTFIRLNADGTQDMAFGDGGFAIHNPPLADDNNRVSIFMSDMVVDAQDRLLLSVFLDQSGSANNNNARYLLRLNPNGSLDATFGVNGYVEYTDDFYISNVQVQPDGKLVVTGVSGLTSDSYCYEMMVKRLYANGQPDLSFGNNGEIRFSPGIVEFARPQNSTWPDTALLLPDGKILLIGFAGFCYSYPVMMSSDLMRAAGSRNQAMMAETAQDEPEISYEFFARLNPDGTLDTTFDGNGVRFLPARNDEDWAYPFNGAIQADGKIIVASGVNIHEYDAQLELTRFMPDGTPDSAWTTRSFRMEFSAPGDDFPNPQVDPTGRILIGHEDSIRRLEGDPAFGYTALTPAHRAGGHPITAPLTLSFAAPVTADAGAIEIRRTADSSLFARLDVSDSARVTGGGSSIIQIDPATDFEPNTAYFVLVDPHAFVNAAGHPFSGVRALTEWHFVTGDAPVIVVPPTQLLLNRGFEGKGAKPSRPAKWTGTRLLASEGRLCNVERKNKPPLIYAQAGRCAFRFKHTAGRGRSIAQTVTPVNALAGGTLRLSAQVRRNGLTTGATLRAQLTYTDGTTDALVIPIPKGSGGYTPFEAALTLTQDLASVKVRAVTGKSKGAWLLDAVSLTVESPSAGVAGNSAGGDGLRGVDLPAGR